MNPFASKELIMARFKICVICPLMKKGLINTCSDCGCPIKSKVMPKNSKCPKGKWK